MAGDVCRVCGAEVRTMITIGGKLRDLEPEPAADGNHIVVEHEGRIRARVLGGHEMPAQQEAYTIHKCPPTPYRMPPGPRCAACGLPMHAELAASQGWRTHPSCVDPEEARAAVMDQIRKRRT